MIYLYLDESGDLGFNFETKKPSNFFTVAILKIQGYDNNRAMIKAVKKTLARKLPKKEASELKGSSTSFGVKEYFYKQAGDIPFEIYALTLNKIRVNNNLKGRKDRLYNFIARNVLDQIPFDATASRIEFIIDKSKNKKGIGEFNEYIVRQLEGRIDPRMPLDIYHYSSHENKGLQAVDLFSWGIFRKYEKQDQEWYDVFEDKIRYDSIE